MAYKYTINGKTYKSETELSDSDLEELAGGATPPEAENQGMTFGEATIQNLPAILGTVAPITANVLAPGLSLPFTGAFAAGGAAAGESLRQYLTGEEADASKMIEEATLGMAGEGIGAGIAKVAPSFVRGAKSVLGLEKQAPNVAIPLAERMAAQETAQQLGTSIPSSRVGGNFSQLLEGMSRAGVGEGSFVAVEKEIGEALTKEVNNIIDSTTSKAMGDIELGNALEASFETAASRVKDAVAPFYNKTIPEQGGGLAVFTSSVNAKATSALNKATALSRSGKTPVGMEPETIRLLKQMSDVKDIMSFADAHALRSDLLRQSRALGNKYGADNEFAKVLKESVVIVNKQMDEAAKNFNPQLQKAYKAVSNKYRRTMEDLYDDVTVSLLKKSPERVGESISRTGNVTEVLKTRKALQRAKIEGVDVKALEDNLLMGYLQGITKGLDGSLDNFLTLSEKLNDKKFKRTYDTMMQINPTAKGNIDKLINAAKVAAKGNQPTIMQGKFGTGGLANTVVLLQGTGAGLGAMTEAGAGAGMAVATGFMGTQLAISKILTSPTATNALLAAERIAQKKGFEAGLDFLSKAKPIRRIFGQEFSRSSEGRDLLKPSLEFTGQLAP